MGEVETALRVRILGAIFCANFTLLINNTIHYCRLGVDSNRNLTGNIKKESDRYRPVPVKDKKRVPDGKVGSMLKGVTGTEPHNRHYVQFVCKWLIISILILQYKFLTVLKQHELRGSP